MLFRSEEEEVERNTGVEFPGQSYEPIIGTTYTLDEKDFREEVIFVEYGNPNFVYKYAKQERVIVG